MVYTWNILPISKLKMKFHNIILTVITFGIINTTAVIIETPLGSVQGSIQK